MQILIFLFTIMLPSIVMAQLATTQVKTAIDQKAEIESETSLLEIEQRFASDLQETNKGDTNLNTITTIASTLPLSRGRSIGLSGKFNKNLNSEEQGLFSNIKLKGNTDYIPTDLNGVKYRHGLSIYAPTNEVDREDHTFQSALAYQPRMIISWKERGIPNDLVIDPSLRKSFFEFKEDNQGQSNVEYRADLLLRNYYDFNERLKVLLLGQYGLHRTYSGIYKENFVLAQEILISLSKKITIGIGHENGGETLQADGSSNFNIYDEVGSKYYTYFYYKM